MWDLADYTTAQYWFQRLLGGIYLTAFLSLLVQVKGLFGRNGISPIDTFLQQLRSKLDWRRYYRIPSLFWLHAGDGTLYTVCAIGIAASIGLLIGFYPHLMAVTLWICYLSFVSTGQEFFSYQWDTLLVEAGFLAIFLPHPVILLALWALLFRLMFMSGIAKWLSADPSWRNLTALTYHYWTQPLPTPLGWYVHQLPRGFHKFSCAATHVIEILVPLYLFTPWPIPGLAVLLIAVLQLLILLTGNYCFFNLLTLLLCLPFLPDSFLGISANVAFHTSGTSLLVGILGGILILLGLLQILSLFFPQLQLRVPLFLVNPYGLFAHMTKERPEIILEASHDGTEWHPYTFRYKPGDPTRAPKFNLPHQPRLDWQLWFLALRHYPEAWFIRLIRRLFAGETAVERLFAQVPIRKPKFIRARLYHYAFGQDQWWTRQLRGELLPPLKAGS